MVNPIKSVANYVWVGAFPTIVGGLGAYQFAQQIAEGNKRYIAAVGLLNPNRIPG